jgi:hypothetical protein
MDNGLIFPYPCGRVPDEAGDTNRPIVVWLRLCHVSAGSELVVVKRWGDAGG